jgi:hypothetical protein
MELAISREAVQIRPTLVVPSSIQTSSPTQRMTNLDPDWPQTSQPIGMRVPCQASTCPRIMTTRRPWMTSSSTQGPAART